MNLRHSSSVVLQLNVILVLFNHCVQLTGVYMCTQLRLSYKLDWKKLKNE